MKKNVLFVYPSMLMGGSTTALLSLLNSMDAKKYNIDLQLFRKEGPLIDLIPAHVNVLEPAELHTGFVGRIIKNTKFLFLGYAFKAAWKGMTGNSKKIISSGVALDFQAKILSKKNKKQYDYAIGYLEGWSDRYLAFSVNADKKYAWLHSTFANITTEPREELAWMNEVDKIVFVTDACRDDFSKAMPMMAEKAITIKNIVDSDIIRKRSLALDIDDEAYTFFRESKAFKIITVCRLTIDVKGLDRVVSCAKSLKERKIDFVWYIVGDGEDREALISMINDSGVQDVVIPIGKRLNPYPFIAAADIMCMPSRYEGKPIVITESMILGVPPVVTEYLSAREQINDGVDGIVVVNEDDAIIGTISNIIEDRTELLSMKKELASKDYGNSGYIIETEEKMFL